MTPIYGIDLSYWQGATIDFKQVAKAGIQFCYIKSSEGTSIHQLFAQTQAFNASANGIKIGYYHFCHTKNNPIDEANFFDSVIKTLPAYDLIPVIDIEANDGNRSPHDFTTWLEGFVLQMTSLGYPEVMIYSYTPFLNQYLVPPSDILAPTKLWIAQYTSLPSPSLPKGYTHFDVWQYSQSGLIAGISGNVDLNLCYELPLA